MFLLKKLITPFVLPPGLLVTACFAAAAWCLYKRRGRPALWAGAGLVLWVLMTPAFHALLLRPLEYRYPQPRDLSGDAIVVLGGGLVPGASDPGGGPALDKEGAARLLAAARLHRQTGLPVVVSGGGFFGGGSWAPAAARALADAGVPEYRIITEDSSADTCGNAFFVAEVFRDREWTRPLVVTSARHLPRTVRAFKAAGFAAVTPVPCGYLSSPGWRGWTSLLPQGGDGLKAALHEHLGRLWYRAACAPRPG
ncbi:MAG: ElyC/SanA/YdcF family protein [Elusimicrobiales bacterium]|nr:ElyC/SanA/YdcF family protein [Elusimicrobiales bacterium]